MKSHYRVVVIGGGVVGSSVLYHLAKFGWSDVVMLERRRLASGSSWHAAGGIHALNADPNMAALQAYTIDLLSEIEAESGQNIGLHMTGGLTLAGTPERWEWLQANYRVFQSIGIDDCELLTPQEAKKRCPIMSTDGVLGAMWADREGYIDTTGTVQAYATAAKKRGAEYYEGVRVEALEQTADGWKVITDKGVITCEHVVNAGGLWAKQVGRMAGIELPVSPLKHHYLITDSIPEVAAADFEMPMTVDLEGFTYMRQDQKGVLVGIYEVDHEHWAMDGAPWDYGEELFQEQLDRIENELTLGFERYPAIQDQDLGQRRLHLLSGRQSAGRTRARQARLLVRLRGDGGLPAGWRCRQDAGRVDDPWRAGSRCLADGCGALRTVGCQQAVYQGDDGAVLFPPVRDELSQ